VWRIPARPTDARVRAARGAGARRRARRDTRPASRPRVGNLVPRWNAYRRRPRRAAAEEARPSERDPDRARRRLSTPRRRLRVSSLRTRLRLAIGAAVLAAVSLSLLVGAYLVRRSLEQS